MTERSDSERRKNGSLRFEQASRIMMWAVGLYIGIISAIQGWTAMQIIDHEVRIVTIEANRWTSTDAANQAQSMMTVLTGIQREFAAVAGRLPTTFPPEETRQTLREYDKRLDVLERELIRKHGGK